MNGSDKQAGYVAKRRAWAIEIGQPWPVDGGAYAGRTRERLPPLGERLPPAK